MIFSRYDLSKVPSLANLKSKKFLEKTFGPVFLSKKVLKNKIQISLFYHNILTESLHLESKCHHVMKHLCLQKGNYLYVQ
jgi:hypothetical protein